MSKYENNNIYINTQSLITIIENNLSECGYQTEQIKIGNDDTLTETLVINIIEEQYEIKSKRNIWENSKWKNISNLENDDVGKAGENIIQSLCVLSKIPSNIDGTKTRNIGGDGTINGHSVEIKTARLSSDGSVFQHELGEKPWMAKYMLFLDIAPDNIYITIFKNPTEEFYKRSGRDNNIKLEPFFPTKSICWRKQRGAFKLDTTIKMNENSQYTFKLNSVDPDKFTGYINGIIPV
jgi:hypothetical protein